MLDVQILAFNDNRSGLRLAAKIDPLGTMNFEYDVVIIGGAFSDAATALMLKR